MRGKGCEYDGINYNLKAVLRMRPSALFYQYRMEMIPENPGMKITILCLVWKRMKEKKMWFWVLRHGYGSAM